jgi:hypothetical protein
MANSQNGYKANDSSLIASYTIARDVKVNVRKGDVSAVLLHFAKWYDQKIEPLTKSDTGGYNPRNIAGSTTLSNHASGTAVDLRWNKHPLGKSGTFTSSQASKIRTQLKYYEGVIRWGGDYTGRKDEMHFEINRAIGEVGRIARKIRQSRPQPKPPTNPPSTHLVVDGELGPKTVKRWQEVTDNPTGKTGALSTKFVEHIQRILRDTVDHRLVVDGELGPKTIGALQRYLKSPVDGVIDKPKSLVIVALQRRLNTGKF